MKCLFKNCTNLILIKDNLCKEHLNKFKCIPCRHYAKGHCPFGNNCTYAHGEEEKREFTELSEECEYEEINESSKKPNVCLSCNDSINMTDVSEFIESNNIVIDESNKSEEIQELEIKYKDESKDFSNNLSIFILNKLTEIKAKYNSKNLVIKNKCNLHQSLHNIENGLLKIQDETLSKRLEYLESVRKRKLDNLQDLISNNNLTSENFLLINCTIKMLYVLQNKCFEDEIINDIKKTHYSKKEEYKRDVYKPVKNILIDKIFKYLADSTSSLESITLEDIKSNQENTENVKKRLLDVIEHIESNEN